MPHTGTKTGMLADPFKFFLIVAIRPHNYAPKKVHGEDGGPLDGNEGCLSHISHVKMSCDEEPYDRDIEQGESILWLFIIRVYGRSHFSIGFGIPKHVSEVPKQRGAGAASNSQKPTYNPPTPDYLQYNCQLSLDLCYTTRSHLIDGWLFRRLQQLAASIT
jgi:hypothetical protein